MQDIIVLIIGLLVFAFVAWKSYKAITRKPVPGQKCPGCDGCSLKDEVSCGSDKKIGKGSK